MLKTEDLTYLKRLVKADLEHMETSVPKSTVGHKLALDYRRRVLKTLVTMTS